MNSDMLMPWGKFKGQAIEDVPSSYLIKWLAENCDDDEICEAADEEYQRRDQFGFHK